jgi:L-2-hydroxyglutarate oxidase LhgO
VTSEADFDVAVIGAGIVGVSITAALSAEGLRVLLVERHATLGTETSSRNSGVVHAGLYYPKDSLKARLCVAGRDQLYARCAALGIGHQRLGKLVVATEPGDLARLEALRERGLENGAGALQLWSPSEVRRRIPEIDCAAALWSPDSGIVDVHELLRSFQWEASERGATLAFRQRLTRVEPSSRRYVLSITAPNGEIGRASARSVVNAAGLDADAVAELAGFDVDALGYRQYLCKGDYFRVSGWPANRLPHLVYPLPDGDGLGIHLTVDLGGQVLAGPDARYVDTRALDVDAGKSVAFHEALKRYVSGLAETQLVPAHSGLRPKLSPKGAGFRDFVITHHDDDSTTWVQLAGIESPGLTASCAIAAHVARWVA